MTAGATPGPRGSDTSRRACRRSSAALPSWQRANSFEFASFEVAETTKLPYQMRDQCSNTVPWRVSLLLEGCSEGGDRLGRSLCREPHQGPLIASASAG